MKVLLKDMKKNHGEHCYLKGNMTEAKSLPWFPPCHLDPNFSSLSQAYAECTMFARLNAQHDNPCRTVKAWDERGLSSCLCGDACKEQMGDVAGLQPLLQLSVVESALPWLVEQLLTLRRNTMPNVQLSKFMAQPYESSSQPCRGHRVSTR